eukprot:gb/GEZN01001529.1/.p1 GENE.gb/GEZN01001529.1/~~gb/GEZN01001529.1/.p1  ORF type:complete len:937 (+),score=146.56 gb/GEZN01001529.1/:29-2839(+)
MDPSASGRSPPRRDVSSYTAYESLAIHGTDAPQLYRKQERRSRRIIMGCIVLIVVLLTILIAQSVAYTREERKLRQQDSAASSPDAAQVSACLDTNLAQPSFKIQEDAPVGADLLLTHGNLWTGLGDVIEDADILLSGGLIAQIGVTGQRLPTEGLAPGRVVDVQGRVVTPGLVDLHSHLGVYSWPDLPASSDGNEMTDPINAQVRALDAITPQDRAMPRARSGGVTTVHVLPGSGNLMGGEGVVLKLRGAGLETAEADGVLGPPYPTVQDMLLANGPRTLKMACGENPKRTYGGRNQAPSTRLGNAWLLRRTFEEAAAEITAQVRWCSQKQLQESTSFPRTRRLDGVAALLRGKAQLHNHCYTVADLEMMIRLSHEFNFSVAAFHHGLEAYKVADRLAQEQIAVATFATSWGFKLEAYDASVHAPHALWSAGVNLVLKSDHPVLDSRFLIFEAAKAHHYDLPAQAALAAVTHNPAKVLGLSDRLGALKQGLDADVVVWDRDPMLLGAQPTLVLIDGVIKERSPGVLPPLPPQPNSSLNRASITESVGSACKSPQPVSQLCTVIRGVTVHSNTGPPMVQQTLIIKNGKWECIGADSNCTNIGGCALYEFPNGAEGILIPGLVDGLSELGQTDIGQEADTKNGFLPGSGLRSDGSARYLQTHVYDGVRLESRTMRAAWMGGVVGVVSKPQGRSLIPGFTSSFPTCCHKFFGDLSVMQKSNALYVQLGNGFKDKSSEFSASYSAQLASLRAVLNSNATEIQQVLERRIPLLVWVDSADVLSSLLRMQREYGFRLVVAGGAEAWMLSSELALAGATVLLRTRPPPTNWETFRVRDDAALVLLQAGVSVGLTTNSEEFTRELRWEAGFLRSLAGLSLVEALAMVTSAPAAMLGLDVQGYGFIREGEPAHFVLLNGDPLQLQSNVQLVGSGTFVQCRPTQI